MNKRPYVPRTLVLWIAGLLIAGLAAGPLINNLATPQQLSDNVLLNAIPFILIFVSILLTFIALIRATASALNHNISESVYRPVERALIAGIVLGVIGMFQPWAMIFYQVGFLVLLFSTLGFILWSHIVPRRARSADE
jgi:cation transport ATPase